MESGLEQVCDVTVAGLWVRVFAAARGKMGNKTWGYAYIGGDERGNIHYEKALFA